MSAFESIWKKKKIAVSFLFYQKRYGTMKNAGLYFPNEPAGYCLNSSAILSARASPRRLSPTMMPWASMRYMVGTNFTL